MKIVLIYFLFIHTLVAILPRVSDIAFITNANRSMYYHVTATIKTARIESARIDTLLIETSLVIRAFGILDAFWNRFCKHVIETSFCNAMKKISLSISKLKINYF